MATALVTLARLGISCAFFGVIGDDDLGEKARHSLAAEGVDTAGVVVRAHADTQAAFIVIEQGSGKRTIFWRRSSGPPLRGDELEAGFLDGSDFLLLDGLMADVSLHAARLARDRNVPIMLDAGRVRPGMLEIAGLCDYVVAAEQFALDLGWNGTLEAFSELARRLGAGVVTITLGERGSITCCNGEIFRVPAFAVEAADTTGAGDVFHGGYVFGLLRGWEVRDAVIFASAAAAMKCRKVGGRAGIPSLPEVTQFLEERGMILSA